MVIFSRQLKRKAGGFVYAYLMGLHALAALGIVILIEAVFL